MHNDPAGKEDFFLRDFCCYAVIAELHTGKITAYQAGTENELFSACITNTGTVGRYYRNIRNYRKTFRVERFFAKKRRSFR